MAKVSIDFSSHNYTDQDLCIKANTISGDLTNNPDFPTLAQDAVLIGQQSGVLIGFLAKMADGNKQLTIQKRAARADLEGTLRSVGFKVQDISGGDEAKILSTGYDVTQKPTPVGILDQPLNVQVSPGKISGTLEISWEVVDHAYSYEVRYTKNPKSDSTVYVTTTTTKRKTILTGLDAGQTYIVQVAGVGSDPRRVWSVEVVSCYVS